METIAKTLASIIDTPERYEIAIDIWDNFEELMLPLKKRFFDAIEKEVQDKFNLDKKVWSFSPQHDKYFCLFKYSWQIDKSDRGVYSFILHDGDGSGLVRNNNSFKPIDLKEEQNIIDIVSIYKGMHKYTQNDIWWLLYKTNPFTWNTQCYKKICNPEAISFKSLVSECVERLDDLLMFMKETDLEQAIDKCIEARRKNNKI